MSEKMRSLNLTTGNLHTLTATGTPTAIPGATLIGAPTLISSTFSGSSHVQTLSPIGCEANLTSPHAVVLGGSDSESTTDFPSSSTAAGTTTAQLNFQLLPIDSAGGNLGLGELNSIMMNTSQISTTTSNDSSGMLQLLSQNPTNAAASASVLAMPSSSGNGKHLAAQSVAGKSCRFPKLEECAHFHYERVQLGPLSVQLVDDKSEHLTNSIASQSIGGEIAQTQSSGVSGTGPASIRSFSPSNCWFIIKVFPHRCEPFLVKRSFENMQMFDEMLHHCVYDRKISGLRNLEELEFKSEEDVEYAVAKYLERFSKIASDSLTCGTILTWLQLDNKGRRLPLADGETQRTINTPAVGAAYGVRAYQAQASDEISIEVGDMISVIDMPSPAESAWWRGKKSHLQKSHYEVGFFPQMCVATIGDKVPRNFPMPAPLVGQLDVSPTKPVLRKHGKLIAFFRSFILSRPSRRRLKQSGIYRERVFSCDLSEHLLNSGQEIPMVLKSCAEFIENYGIIDGIYRLSGITSNIQRLRRAFDEERVPDLGNPEMKQDIHAVSSLLKMYFRELPNPLCTYQLYDNFVEAIQEKSESQDRLRLMKETVLKLPPPHYRTLKYLSEHLNKISQHHERTGMTDKNLAIVWAPNLLRSPALESGGVAALRGVGVQAVVTEYLIRNCHNIFDALEDANPRLVYNAIPGAAYSAAEVRMDSLTDCESLLVEQREHDQAITIVERPKSLSAGGAKLISLEEARERHSKVDGFDIKQSMPISMVSSNTANIGSYIEVGGGPSSLPDKYHTVLSVPRSWQKRKTHSWKSLFSRNQRPVSSGGAHDLKTCNSHAEESELVHNHKEATQVTFAEVNSIIVNSGKMGKGLLKQEKPKSIELFETTREVINKPMDVCVRSNSIDSLRTAGHSRSVSHDSYFDLLQSPQRGHMTTCPSRELSELGINFDREEPEMRIFSETESLVSSPRVGKENIPPSSGQASRRIMRARPEEFSSQTNSVNPSPKKQPRLNLLLSPSSAAASALPIWPQASNESTDVCEEHKHHSSDESCCKRYKLEDQLSDIQYIDCSTPEHANVNPQSLLYASAQVHAPPQHNTTKTSNMGFSSTERGNNAKDTVMKANGSATATPSTGVRYSYPSIQLGSKRKEQDGINNSLKERFSYPGSSSSSSRNSTTKTFSDQDGGDIFPVAPHTRTVSFVGGPQQTPVKTLSHHAKPSADLLCAKNRNSYCGNQDFIIDGSESGEFKGRAEAPIERMKLSITPSSPVRSPSYSLLVGDTSSENSSAAVTPQYDLDPLMVASAMSGLSGISGTSSNQLQQQQLLLGVDSHSYLGTSHESIGSNLTSSPMNALDKRDMHALKRELSLDLQPISSKMSNDSIDGVNRAATLPSKQLHQQQMQQHMIPSPNNSNFTDNTSQSVTPSEFGYQNLMRQLSMHSLIETDENSTAYEDYGTTPSNAVSPLSGDIPKGGSPRKSTISITYNLKSPSKESSPTASDKSRPKALLETSFDENIVYEQVKLFRNSVTEVNELLNDNRKSLLTLGDLDEEEYEKEMEDQSVTKAAVMSDELLQLTTGNVNMNMSNENDFENANDIDDDNDNDDACSDEEKLLYENVELRKPKSVYENLLGEEMKVSLLDSSENDSDKLNDKIELDSLDSIKTSYTDKMSDPVQYAHRKSPSNFSVKELATKFESSPVEQLPAFDFSQRGSMKKLLSTYEAKPNAEPASPLPTVVGNANEIKQKLNKSQQITRSLDENAFVREFGTKQLLDLNTRGSQQLPELAEVNNRRKSFDFTRPKTLNPPKRLPGMPITEEICQSRKETDEYEGGVSIRITPTTENRISLIQNNVASLSGNHATAASAAASATGADLNNSNANLKGCLSGVKLDRERIDRIKEERRQQLTQKYHSESLKSRSKTDLNSSSKDDDKKFHAESMRVKSKSRGDMNSLQKDMDNARPFGRSSGSCLHAGSESTLNYSTTRVRSISDEKNQNCDMTPNSNTSTSNSMMPPPKSKNSNTTHNTSKPLITTGNTLNDSPKKTSTSSCLPEYEEFSARATVQKFERKTLDFANGGNNVVTRERNRDTSGGIYAANGTLLATNNRNSAATTREKISPQFSIRDMTAMFESRSQNQQ